MHKKFLDKYVGDTFTFVNENYKFFIISNKGEIVLCFYVILSTTGTNNFHLIRGDKLCRTVSVAFGLDDDESMKVVRDWIGDTLGIKMVSDLSSFIKEFV